MKDTLIKGTITNNGTIIGDDGKNYYPMISVQDQNTSILLAGSSWSRIPLNKVIGKRVKFTISVTGHGYNYKLCRKLK